MAIATHDSTTAELVYSIPPPTGVKPVTDITQGGKKNYALEEKTVIIENVRGKEETVSLDTTGFQFVQHPTKFSVESFLDDKIIQDIYYKEAVDIIKKTTGASRVEIFDHTIRRRKTGVTDMPGARQPAAQVHGDQTNAAAISRVHRHMPAADVPNLLAKRFQIINLWRPIERQALDWPLALCDARTVKESDLFPVAIIFPGREGETMGVKFNPDHRWKYLYGMTPEELVLIKCFDSLQDGTVAVFTPHTGFQDPLTPEGTPPRQSIELRALVFYE